MIFTELPIWLQNLITWITTGTGIASICGLLTVIVKQRHSNKSASATSGVQTTLLQTIVDKLNAVDAVLHEAQNVSNAVSEVLLKVEAFIDSQKRANNNLAQFVFECFNKSNLSDEKKAELSLLMDKLFYEDTNSLIAALTKAKDEADAAVIAARTELANVKQQLEEANNKCAIAQENVKSSRRV